MGSVNSCCVRIRNKVLLQHVDGRYEWIVTTPDGKELSTEVRVDRRPVFLVDEIKSGKLTAANSVIKWDFTFFDIRSVSLDADNPIAIQTESAQCPRMRVPWKGIKWQIRSDSYPQFSLCVYTIDSATF